MVGWWLGGWWLVDVGWWLVVVAGGRRRETHINVGNKWHKPASRRPKLTPDNKLGRAKYGNETVLKHTYTI